MRQASIKQRISKTFSASAPTKGWNTLDAISTMEEGYAVILQNFIPTPSNVSLRKGSVSWATGMTGRVESLFSYNSPNGTVNLFAAAAGNIYDVTLTGVVGTPVVTGKSNNRWQHINFATPAGNFLYLVNGVDSPLLYNGTTWNVITGASTPAITGVTTSTFINVSLFKNKLWFVEANSMRVWYLPSASIAGAASVLDLSSLFPRGGYLMAMG